MKAFLILGCAMSLISCARLSADVHVFAKHESNCLTTGNATGTGNAADSDQNVAKALFDEIQKTASTLSVDEMTFTKTFQKPANRDKFKEAYSKKDPSLKESWQTAIREDLHLTDKNVDIIAAADSKVRSGAISPTYISTYGLSTLEDRWTSSILYAHESCWEKKYGTASGTGVFGNSDIAIKMDGPGDFVVKGLRLDASKMTQALFKGLNQGIILLANAYGASALRAPDGQSQGGDIDSFSNEVANAEQETLDSKFSIRQAKGRILRLFEEIVAQRSTLEPTSDSTWQTALTNIQKSVESYQKLVKTVK